MPLRVWNTLTDRKEEFVPLQAGRLGMYVCGITVYDVSHVGHAYRNNIGGHLRIAFPITNNRLAGRSAIRRIR